MAEAHFDPGSYADDIRAEIPRYDELQHELVRATEGVDARRILELGTGTGETAGLVLERHPQARLVGIDLQADMLDAARRSLPADRIEELRAQNLTDPLPAGPFELVVSALAVHHLQGDAKRDLFHRVSDVLAHGGRFVLGDVVVPEDPADAEIPLSEGYDFPDPVGPQLDWLREAAFEAGLVWTHRDLALLVADRSAI